MAALLERKRVFQGRIEAARSDSALLDTVLEVVERDSDFGGGLLSGALAYRLFVFTLPLALFLVSGLGVLSNLFDTDPEKVASQAGLTGLVTQQVASASSGSSNWWVAITSFFVLVYVTRALYRSLAVVHALIWERSAASAKVTARALEIFAAVIVGELLVVVGVAAVRHELPVGGVVALLFSLFASAALWLVVTMQLPHSGARWTDLVPGALLFGVGVLAVHAFSVYLLGRILESKASTYGALGTAAAILLTLFFFGRVIIGAAVLNSTLVARRERSASGSAR